jgi:hypothetical protein
LSDKKTGKRKLKGICGLIFIFELNLSHFFSVSIINDQKHLFTK